MYPITLRVGVSDKLLQALNGPVVTSTESVCSRCHNDVALIISIEEVVFEVAAVLHRSCTQHMDTLLKTVKRP